MTTSQNGYTVYDTYRYPLREWAVPARSGAFSFNAVHGARGFLLVHNALWFAERVERVAGGGDDFGWSYREIAGTDVFSNHASGTAVDLNSARHPDGIGNTFSTLNRAKMRLHLLRYGGTVRWGGDYNDPDEMHWEINLPLTDCEAVARRLMTGRRGRRILEVNKGQGAVILD